MIDKGVISAFYDNESKAEVIPSMSKDTVTAPLVVPDLLKGSLAVNMEVVFVMFSDNTGMILDRLDGKNEHRHNAVTGEVEV